MRHLIRSAGIIALLFVMDFPAAADCSRGSVRAGNGSVVIWYASQSDKPQSSALFRELPAVLALLAQHRIGNTQIDCSQAWSAQDARENGVTTVPAFDVHTPSGKSRIYGYSGISTLATQLGLTPPARPEAPTFQTVPPRQAAPGVTPAHGVAPADRVTPADAVTPADLQATAAQLSARQQQTAEELRRHVDVQINQFAVEFNTSAQSWHKSIDGWEAVSTAHEQRLGEIEQQIDQLRAAIAAVPAGRAGKDGTNGRPGKDGINGRPGTDGRDGAFIASAQITTAGRLILIRSDGQEIDAGPLPAAAPENLDEFAQRVAAIEQRIEEPFEVQLFTNGEPVTDVRSVQPHGGWLPIDLPWDVVSPAASQEEH